MFLGVRHVFLGQECVTNPKERLRERLHDDWPVPVSKRVSQSCNKTWSRASCFRLAVLFSLRPYSPRAWYRLTDDEPLSTPAMPPGGDTQQMFLQGGSSPRFHPLTLLHTIFQLMKSVPFHIPEAWKRYPFRAEPPRIGNHREYSPRAAINLLNGWTSVSIACYWVVL